MVEAVLWSVLVDVLGLPVAALPDAASNDDTVILVRCSPSTPGSCVSCSLCSVTGGYETWPIERRGIMVMFEVRYWEDRPEGGLKQIGPMWKVEDAFARLR